MAEKARKEKSKTAPPREISSDEYIGGAEPATSGEAVAPADAPVAAVAEEPVVPRKPAGPVDKLKASLVTVLRVQEATLQEERLITTGNFKDLQRNNVKMATRMMIDNYSMGDTVVRATAFLSGTKVQEATEVGKGAIEDLQSILDYFDESADSLKATELSKDKKAFLLKALGSSRSKLDKFLSYFDREKVAAARAQVIEENELNQKEFPKDMTIINPIFMN